MKRRIINFIRRDVPRISTGNLPELDMVGNSSRRATPNSANRSGVPFLKREQNTGQLTFQAA
ncbi:hypothetical protein ACFFOP_37565 [Sinosporangium siamense]|uniref:hypothetical protein n=1 Tax=Sinosporangium siamense TaxID=1367973 RepID=UPI0035E68042